jgi:hypothetical protein
MVRNFISLSEKVRELSAKNKMRILISTVRNVFFLVFHKTGIIKSGLSFEYISPLKLSL